MAVLVGKETRVLTQGITGATGQLHTKLCKEYGTQMVAGVVLIPFIPLWPPAAAPAPLVVASILALGLLSGAIAYLLYFRLIADIGATGALTVTYLIPAFGVLWGALFLGEALTLPMLAGAALVVLGTVFVLRS